jgi:hypothetical protein
MLEAMYVIGEMMKKRPIYIVLRPNSCNRGERIGSMNEN